MAGELASFFIRLSTVFDDTGFKKAHAGMKETEGLTQKLNGALGELGLAVSAGAAIWKLIDFSEQSVMAFAEQERASERLRVAMKNLGVFTKEAFQANLEFAASLQRSTTFADDAIIEAQQLLTTYGLYGQKLKDTVIAATDLATARNVDLNTAVMLLGKAYNGQVDTLSRYGLAISKTGETAKDFERVLDQIRTRMGGAAANATNDLIGKTEQLKNSFGELKEAIGAELAPTVSKYVTDLRTIADGITDYLNKRHEANRTDKTAVQILNEQRQGYYDNLNALKERADVLDKAGRGDAAANVRGSSLYKALEENIRRVNDEISKQVSLEAQRHAKPVVPTVEPPKFSDEAVNAAMKQAEKDLALREEADKKIQSHRMTTEEIQRIDSEELAHKLQLRGQSDKADELRAVAKEKFEKDMAAKRVAVAASTFSYIATLANSQSKVLAGIGKAGAIAEATINGHVAFTKAMASFPPPYNFILATGVLAACLAQVASISGIQMAEGGMLRATAGGVPVTMAEAGHDEVAIPLGDPRTKARLADTLLPRGFTPQLLQDALRGGGGGGSRSIQVVIQQENNFGNVPSSRDPQGQQDVLDLMEKMRVATKEGADKALDAVKQFHRTAVDRDGEA